MDTKPAWKIRKAANRAAREQMRNVEMTGRRTSGSKAIGTYGTSEGFSSPKGPRGPRARRRRGLPKCSWVFWHEPDDTNFGPQIMVTEPDETTHYLIDVATFWAKLR